MESEPSPALRGSKAMARTQAIRAAQRVQAPRESSQESAARTPAMAARAGKNIGSRRGIDQRPTPGDPSRGGAGLVFMSVQVLLGHFAPAISSHEETPVSLQESPNLLSLWLALAECRVPGNCSTICSRIALADSVSSFTSTCRSASRNMKKAASSSDHSCD